MKRAGNLTYQIADTDNLLLAFHKALRGKRKNSEAMAFQKKLEQNIARMRDDILSGDVEVGKYEYFYIEDPKLRLICAASFRERVLHHAIMNVCHQCFERNLIDSTYATRPDKGIYKAIDRAKMAMKKYGYVAKFDFRKYFDSISHDILKEKLARMFKDKNLLGIMSAIIGSYEKTEGKGIPIGNLTSQYFANYYLSQMDHWIKEDLMAPEYIRYMDDFLVFADTWTELGHYVEEIKSYAEGNLKLTLKPVVKSVTSEGVDFLGYRIYANKILLTRRSKQRFIRKMRMYDRMLESGEWNERDYYEHITPLLSYAEKGYTKGLRARFLRHEPRALTACSAVVAGTTTRRTAALRIGTTTAPTTATTTSGSVLSSISLV
ncbi:MAG: RNA-directed DNA polymerase [Bacteroidales bacterium]|nr:RNA-directed DNA polymerase [Bacteroidales bacterium]